jgi:hypothetical protein
MGTDDQRYLPQDHHAWIRTCPKRGHPSPQIRSMWWFSPFLNHSHFDMISSSQNFITISDFSNSTFWSPRHFDIQKPHFHCTLGRRCTLDLYGIDAFLQLVRPPFENAKLVNITPITMVYGTYIELVTGAYKPTWLSWGPHIVAIQVLK